MRKYFCILSVILLSVFLTYIPCYTNDFVDSFKEAKALAKSGDYPAAISVFQNLLDKYPDFHEVNYRIGELYFRMDKNAEAVPYLKRAIELDNDSFMPHYLLAECLTRTGKLQEAYEIEQKALK